MLRGWPIATHGRAPGCKSVWGEHGFPGGRPIKTTCRKAPSAISATASRESRHSPLKNRTLSSSEVFDCKKPIMSLGAARPLSKDLDPGGTTQRERLVHGKPVPRHLIAVS